MSKQGPLLDEQRRWLTEPESVWRPVWATSGEWAARGPGGGQCDHLGRCPCRSGLALNKFTALHPSLRFKSWKGILA